MILRDLLQEFSYKSVFNFIYKNFLKAKKLPKEAVMDLDIEFHAIFMSLRNAKQSSPEHNKIYITHISNEIDVCLFDEVKDEIFTLDSVDYKYIIDMEIYKAIEIDNLSILGYILYSIYLNNGK